MVVCFALRAQLPKGINTNKNPPSFESGFCLAPPAGFVCKKLPVAGFCKRCRPKVKHTTATEDYVLIPLLIDRNKNPPLGMERGKERPQGLSGGVGGASGMEPATTENVSRARTQRNFEPQAALVANLLRKIRTCSRFA